MMKKQDHIVVLQNELLSLNFDENKWKKRDKKKLLNKIVNSVINGSKTK